MRFLDLRSVITSIKNPRKRLNSRFDIAEPNKISELEDKSIKAI